jgi:septum formation protein
MSHSKSQIVLASASPRRQDLLKAAGLQFDVIVPNIHEERHPGERPDDYVCRNSKLKNDAVASIVQQSSGYHSPLIISADTIVVLGDEVLEKPVDGADAVRMLVRLSANTHQVITGFCIARVGDLKSAPFVSRVQTEVEFKRLSEPEIARYVATGEPMDKAGAYAAQGVAAYLIRRIVGSYTNVIGLPVAEVLDALDRNFGYRL